jgi:hypothetical protein
LNKEELQQRIMQIDAEMTQLKANYAKLEGHMGEAQHWMSLLVKGEEILAPLAEEANDGEAVDEVAEQTPQE